VKIGERTILLRSAREEDAEALLSYMKIIYGETPYLIREPGEVTLTLEQEKNFIREREESARDLLLLAFENGAHIGNCSVSGLGNFSRYAHRCDVAIALYQKYCGSGIGRKMMEEALFAARNMGYEQAELEVAASNLRAIRLYESLGFQKYGTFPNNMKYKDGAYEDADWMMKKLVQ
jgi:RimJ/RimL family protein N-acetyltransferase